MALKRYELWFWNYDPDYPNRLRLVKREVLVPPETLKGMCSYKSPAFYKFYINDGEEFFVDAENVHSLRQIFNQSS